MLSISKTLASFCSIHPRDKVTVGRRLAASGLTQAYNLSTRHQGPIPTKFESGKQTLRIIFDEGKTILIVRNSRGFEVISQNIVKRETVAILRVHSFG